MEIKPEQIKFIRSIQGANFDLNCQDSEYDIFEKDLNGAKGYLLKIKEIHPNKDIINNFFIPLTAVDIIGFK